MASNGLSPGANPVIPNISPTPSLDYEDRLGNGVQVSVDVVLCQWERPRSAMAPLRRELVSTNLILRHVRTDVTGQGTASLSILVGGWDALTENYGAEYAAKFTDAKVRFPR